MADGEVFHRVTGNSLKPSLRNASSIADVEVFDSLGECNNSFLGNASFMANEEVFLRITGNSLISSLRNASSMADVEVFDRFKKCNNLSVGNAYSMADWEVFHRGTGIYFSSMTDEQGFHRVTESEMYLFYAQITLISGGFSELEIMFGSTGPKAPHNLTRSSNNSKFRVISWCS